MNKYESFWDCRTEVYWEPWVFMRALDTDNLITGHIVLAVKGQRCEGMNVEGMNIATGGC